VQAVADLWGWPLGVAGADHVGDLGHEPVDQVGGEVGAVCVQQVVQHRVRVGGQPGQPADGRIEGGRGEGARQQPGGGLRERGQGAGPAGVTGELAAGQRDGDGIGEQGAGTAIVQPAAADLGEGDREHSVQALPTGEQVSDGVEQVAVGALLGGTCQDGVERHLNLTRRSPRFARMFDDTSVT